MLTLQPLLLLVLFPLFCEASFVLQIATEDEQCFVIRAPPNSLVSGNFDVLDDHLSPDPITFKLLEGDDMDSLYQSEHGLSEDTFRVRTKEGGRLYACIQNGIDYESEDELDRTVGLDVRVTPLSSQDDGLLASTEALQEKLWDLQNHFDYMRNREVTHRETTERTFSNVVRWSLLEFCVLLVIAITQVMALRFFFERRRYV